MQSGCVPWLCFVLMFYCSRQRSAPTVSHVNTVFGKKKDFPSQRCAPEVAE